ncbi:MAG: glycoside hydrolase family 92 protein [Verrucomicrobia bacterium]|nr:glycoside hydrolase family 92 protein [Verrucomicrobiota bacterium]
MTGDDNTRPLRSDQEKKSGKRRGWWWRWLKRLLCFVLLVLMACAAFVGALVYKHSRIVGAKPGVLKTTVQPTELGRMVNPFIGTGGFPWVCGHNFPGAMVPFGMVRLGPETASMLTRQRALNTSGYYYGDDQLLGFSHTRLSGTGATDGGHFLVMPAIEAVQPKLFCKGQTTRFSHSEELASPGYYAVKLPQIGTLVELTATARVGVHRYTFSEGRTPHLMIDVMNALGGRKSREGNLLVRPEANEVEGSVRTFGTFAGRYGGIKVYFVARFSQPFATFNTWQNDKVFPGQKAAEGEGVGVDLGFAATNQPQVITLKVAISHVSIENARANLDTEAGTKSFDEVFAKAQQTWDDRLSLIKIQGGTETQRRIFYTALYRVFQMPTVFNDANGDYLGFDRKVHQVSDFQYFTDLSMWDTFRTTHPLYTLLSPKDQRDMVVSLIKMLEQGGWLPRWPSGHGYSNSMLGTPADIVIAETYLKGIRNFDVEQAYQAMRRTALEPTPPGAAFSGREGVKDYLKYGYCPSGLMDESVSRTFDFGWADRAISLLAESLGHHEDAILFREHSQFYRNLWNTNTQYFQPRDAQEKFFEPFKPLLLTYMDRGGKFTRDYVEGSALQWRWAAPYDAEGMISLFKSREYFVDELETFFAKSDPKMGAWTPGSYYWHGNQPDIHAAYLFNDASRPDLTQKWVRWILDNKYSDAYDGLDGNDDAGTLSAWYVFSALGFYPVAGTDRYQLGTPLFEKAEVKLTNKPLVIVADNYATNHMYVRRVLLNDLPLDRTWIRHSEIEQGGVLRFEMSAVPARE